MTQEERIFCYRFFSEFFKGTFVPGLSEHWKVIAEIFGVKADVEFDQRLRQAWARTFYGVGSETVTLTQSSWTNPLRLQCQEPCLKAHDAYVAAGVSPETGDDALPEDHVSLLLGFMAWQLANGADARPFFENHFGLWWNSLQKAAVERLENPTAEAVWTAFERFLAEERLVFAKENAPAEA